MSITVLSDGTEAASAVSDACRELVESLAHGRGVPGAVRRLERAATHWAAAGIPARVFHTELRKCLKEAVGNVVRAAASSGDVDPVVDVMVHATAAVSDVYHAIWCDRRLGIVQSLAAALLSGDSPERFSRECGIAIAPAYWVVALSLPLSSDGIGNPPRSEIVWQRIRAELADTYGDRLLPRFSAGGGTVLVPAANAVNSPDSLIRELSMAAHVPIVGTAVWAAWTDVPAGGRRAHELLEVALVFGRAGRLYTFADLALEYQLTRPGAGREKLAARLDPLEDHPHLQEALRLHLRDDLSRQRIAHMLNVHANTLDYRLRRVGELTGLDPFTPGGRWYLRSALVARTSASNVRASQQARLTIAHISAFDNGRR